MNFIRSLIVPILFGALSLAGCNESSIGDFAPNPNKPLPEKVLKKMKAKGMRTSSPITMRIIKDEHLLEIWKQKESGRYDLIAAYNICAWSGKLGQKKKEGDRQAPEGFYTIRAPQLNPASKYFLAFDTGYPNAYDRSHGFTGTNLMVHGACSSSGCYSMTDESVQEIFAFARDSLKGGQESFVLQALPFRMTAEKMAYYSGDPNFPFWNMIKEGYDHFELTRQPPKVDFCEKKYVFNRTPADGGKFQANASCVPSTLSAELESAYSTYQSKYDVAFAKARDKYSDVPAPIVMGGKSRPLDKKWKPKVVDLPSTMAFAAPSVPSASARALSQKPEPATINREETTASDTGTLYETASATSQPDPGPETAPASASDVQGVASTSAQLASSQAEVKAPIPQENPAAALPTPVGAPEKKKRWWLLGN